YKQRPRMPDPWQSGWREKQQIWPRSPGPSSNVLRPETRHLEHCHEPWIAVQNVHRWLKAGGTVFAWVPNAQRLHRNPRDCWRILPDGLESMFEGFSILKVGAFRELTDRRGLS